MCPIDYTAVAGSGKVGPVNRFNHTSWVAVHVVTPTPKSVCNRCVIELFLCCCLCCHFTDEGSLPEMRIWSILLIISDLKWCIHLSRNLFLYLPF